MNNKQRTTIDWSKHKVHYSESQNAKIWTLKKDGTRYDMVTFINSCGVMSVTGDYGDWIFCREFWPMGSKVSEGYWLEKLRIGSDQSGVEFDKKGTHEMLIEEMFEAITQNDESIFWDMKKEAMEEVKPQIIKFCKELANKFFFSDDFDKLMDEYSIGDREEKALRYYADCLNFLCDDTGYHRYEIHAYDNLPDGYDHDDIIISKEIKHSLKAVFDAYDEIVRRYHETKHTHEYFKIMGMN